MAAEWKITVTRKGNFFAGKAPEIIRSHMTSAIVEGTLFLERKVKLGTPIGVYGAKGGLASTVYGEVQGKGMPVVKGIVSHQSKYGDVIEKGRRAGKAWPPEGSLIRWIEVKMGKTVEEAQKIEFVIRRKIGRKGFPGAHMFEKAFKDNWSKLERIFGHYGFEIARELNV